ncbi:MAG: tRNA (N6-isopentenyl adenosine(37)-C2)-methylthiotransferase MiaB [Clostridia bacterium]|nr:tRNA (N6-isopentenyl adenosine(37)-C2)-methylthiotransferase MiaB [Clostridia bacterium]
MSKREKTTRAIDGAEMARQAEATREVAALVRQEGHPLSYVIVTYGCQMNAHDSENLAGMLQEMGIEPAPCREEADLVIYNTCCVRENAERRALGNVTWLKELKKTRPGLLVGVCGCMIQQQGMAQRILDQYPFVDVAFGTHNLYRFPELLHRALSTRGRVVEVAEDHGGIPEELPVRRVSPFRAYLTIMYGCDNFCSYCIVPYVRGRERSRGPEAILAEARGLFDEGVQEIMLLGQNVNSYGNDLGGATRFPELLAELDGVGIPRIRFMTSHPKDLSDGLIEVMAQGKHICHALHLPVQAGSDAVLASMRRGYTRAQYLERVETLRARIPDIALTTDLIVAYPGETEQDFADTLSLAQEVRYHAAFTFVYSPRPGTLAADLPDCVSAQVAKERIEELIRLQKGITTQWNRAYVGQEQQILVEELSKRDATQVAGKNEYGITVNFPGDGSLIGQFARVGILSAAETTLRGQMISGS